MISIPDIIAFAQQNSCSDIHLSEGSAPSLRRHGTLHLIPELGVADAAAIHSLLNEAQQQQLAAGRDLDFAASLCGGRQRVNIFRQSGRLAMALRLLSDTIPTLEQLKLPPALSRLADEPLGLVLVTGPTGSGKSTTLAAMIDQINRSRPCHIITIEDPVEYIYHSQLALVHQREVGRDVESFAAALRSALREDPDVILVGEMRDYETIAAAVTAAETGHLVFSTLHTTGAAHTVDRIIDVFPPHAQNQIRSQLAGVLRGVITQKLLPLADNSGRIAATEVLLGNDAVLNLIREGKSHQINTVLQSNAALGMHTLEGDLARLVRQGSISRDTALSNAANPNDLLRLLG